MFESFISPLFGVVRQFDYQVSAIESFEAGRFWEADSCNAWK